MAIGVHRITGKEQAPELKVGVGVYSPNCSGILWTGGPENYTKSLAKSKQRGKR